MEGNPRADPVTLVHEKGPGSDRPWRDSDSGDVRGMCGMAVPCHVWKEVHGCRHQRSALYLVSGSFVHYRRHRVGRRKDDRYTLVLNNTERTRSEKPMRCSMGFRILNLPVVNKTNTHVKPVSNRSYRPETTGVLVDPSEFPIPTSGTSSKRTKKRERERGSERETVPTTIGR